MSHPSNGIQASANGSDAPPLLLLAAASRLLPLLDPQPGRPGLVDTPRRFAQALEGAMKGYHQEPTAILQSALFHEEGCWSDKDEEQIRAGATATAVGGHEGVREQSYVLPPSQPEQQLAQQQAEAKRRGAGWQAAGTATVVVNDVGHMEMMGTVTTPPASTSACLSAEGGGEGGLVLVQDMHVFSSCAHCLLPLRLTCHAAYVPAGSQVVGLSKLPRAAQALARRRQCGHSLAAELATAVQKAVHPRGAITVVQAAHLVGLEGAVTARRVRKEGEEGNEEGGEEGAKRQERESGWAVRGGEGYIVACAASGCLRGEEGRERREEVLALLGLLSDEVDGCEAGGGGWGSSSSRCGSTAWESGAAATAGSEASAVDDDHKDDAGDRVLLPGATCGHVLHECATSVGNSPDTTSHAKMEGEAGIYPPSSGGWSGGGSEQGVCACEQAARAVAEGGSGPSATAFTGSPLARSSACPVLLATAGRASWQRRKEGGLRKKGVLENGHVDGGERNGVGSSKWEDGESNVLESNGTGNGHHREASELGSGCATGAGGVQKKADSPVWNELWGRVQEQRQAMCRRMEGDNYGGRGSVRNGYLGRNGHAGSAGDEVGEWSRGKNTGVETVDSLLAVVDLVATWLWGVQERGCRDWVMPGGVREGGEGKLSNCSSRSNSSSGGSSTVCDSSNSCQCPGCLQGGEEEGRGELVGEELLQQQEQRRNQQQQQQAVLLLAVARLVCYLVAGTSRPDSAVSGRRAVEEHGREYARRSRDACTNGSSCNGAMTNETRAAAAARSSGDGCMGGWREDMVQNGHMVNGPRDLRPGQVSGWLWQQQCSILNSLCEHHLLPFFGSVHVICAFEAPVTRRRNGAHDLKCFNGLEETEVSLALPSEGQDIGNGSHCGSGPGAVQALTSQLLYQICQRFGRRLQVQERATRQIGEQVMHAVGCAGVVVVVHAHHLCMAGRGAQQPNASTATIASLGVLATLPVLRCFALRQLKHVV